MVKMKTIREHKFQGKDRVVGEVYEATASDADTVRRIGWAEDHVEEAETPAKKAAKKVDSK